MVRNSKLKNILSKISLSKISLSSILEKNKTLKKRNLQKNLAQDESERRNKIHMANPNIFGTRLDGDDTTK